MHTSQRVASVCLVVAAVSCAAGARGAHILAASRDSRPFAVQHGDAPVKPDAFLGTWSGTWEGAGSGGRFDLTLEQPKEGPMAGRVTVTGEPAYTTALKSLSFEATKMTAKYDFPADPAGEITLRFSFEGNTATGTWSLVEKATGKELATGTIAVTRK